MIYKMSKCPYCNKEINDEDVFYKYCGQSLKNNDFKLNRF